MGLCPLSADPQEPFDKEAGVKGLAWEGGKDSADPGGILRLL